MKKSIFSKIGDRIRNKPNNKSKTSDQIQKDQAVSVENDDLTEVKETDASKLDEERKQTLSEETSESEIKDTNQSDAIVDQNESSAKEEIDSKSENESSDGSDEMKSSDLSEDHTDADSQIDVEMKDGKTTADDVNIKGSDASEKNDDSSVDDQSTEITDQSVADVVDADISVDESGDSDAKLEEAITREDVSEKKEEQLSEDAHDVTDDAEEKSESSDDIVEEPDESEKSIQDSDETESVDNGLEEDEDKSESPDDIVEDIAEVSDEEIEESKDSEQVIEESEKESKESEDKSDDDIPDNTEEQSEDTEDVIDESKEKSEESNEVIDESNNVDEDTDVFGNKADDQDQEESSETDSNAEDETGDNVKSDITEIEEAEEINESTIESNEAEQKIEDTESDEQTPPDDVEIDDEESDNVDSIDDADSNKLETEDQDRIDTEDHVEDQTTDTGESKETEPLDDGAEEDILSEVASSYESDNISREADSKDDISEPTEELPIISGAMLDSKEAFSGIEDDNTAPSVALSEEEIAELSESESASETEAEESAKDDLSEESPAEDEVSPEDKVSEDSLTKQGEEEDAVDFFVVPDIPDKKDTSEPIDEDTGKTEVLPVSESKEKADQKDKAAQTGKVIDLSEPEEEKDTKDKSEATKKERPKKPEKQNKGKIVLGILAAIVGVLAVCYVGGFIFYQNHFFFGTKISGVNASNKTVEEVEKSIEKDAKDYSLTLKEREGQSETIKAKDINLRYSNNNPVQTAMNKQNPFKWPLAVFGINDDELPTVYEYDEAKLNKTIQNLNAVSSMVNAENAHPVYSNGQIIIKGMIQGNEVDPKALTSEIKKSIAKGDETLDLEANKIYKNPAYGEDAQEVEAAKKVMEGYLQSEITYTIGEAKEVLDKEDFGPWLMTDESMNVYIDQAQAADWIHQNLGGKYDTAWGEHDFKNSAGQQMKVEGGNYGWEIDEATELNQLMTIIPSGQKNTHEPAWAQTALAGKGTHADIGNTYIEISLGSQHMWCYKDGKLVIDTDVVTGDVNLGRGTPAGVFYIYSMQENATLVGEDYRTPVAYWMPFNGGVGIHDSTWRGASEYGGTTYMGNGSHGCVNTPLDVVAVIFQNADVGEPVVVYY